MSVSPFLSRRRALHLLSLAALGAAFPGATTFAAEPTIADRVRRIVVDWLAVEPEKVTDEARFMDDLGADWFDMDDLVEFFEREFGIDLPEDAAETIVTFGDAVRMVTEHTQQAGPR